MGRQTWGNAQLFLSYTAAKSSRCSRAMKVTGRSGSTERVPDDATGHNRNPIRRTWPVSLHPKPCGFPALVCLGTGVAFGGLAFCSSMGNEQNPQSVVFDGLRWAGGGVLAVCSRGQQRVMEPDGR